MGLPVSLGGPSGWNLVLLLLLAASWGVFWFLYFVQGRRLETQRRARRKAEIEESRVFDFLRGLGEAFASEVRPGELHRLIVKGAARILEAQGGLLFLQENDTLAQTFISQECPPLETLRFGTNGSSLPRETGDGAADPELAFAEIAERAWRSDEAILIGGARRSFARTNGGSAMLAPLTYAQRNLGVLAVLNGANGKAFTDADFIIFKAIAEQSAFALYTALVYSQASERKRLDLDLQVAQDIQRILLPSAAPLLDGYEIDGVNMPARQMSGDYYDYIRVDEHRWGIVIADVSGKGVAASLIMAMCRSVLRSNAPHQPYVAEVLHKVNRQLFPDIKEDMFISMAYLILDDRSNVVSLCRAGHDAPLHYSASAGTVTKINPRGMALGIDNGDVFSRVTGDYSITLEQDDCLILYTDGVTEALDSTGMEFGMKRMIAAIQQSARDGAAAVKKRLTDELVKFIGAYPQNDDVTVIVIRKK